MRLLNLSSVEGGLALAVLSGLALSGKHDEGHKKQNYGVGYVEEGGIVGYSCHEGWVPQGEGPGMVCLNKVKTPLLPVCATGILEGSECLLSEPAIFSCPPGYVEVGGYGGKKDHHDGGKKHGGKKHGSEPLCMQVERVPMLPYCQGGGELLNGQCARKEIAPATMICPLNRNGGHKHGDGKKGHALNDCIETIDVPPVLTCPPGLALQGAMCVGSGEGPCPIAGPLPIVLEGKKGKHGRGLEEVASPGTMRELGEKNKHDYGLPMLAPVPSKVKMCTLEILEPALPVCPPGSFETGGYHGGHKDKKKHGHGLPGLRCAQTVDVPLEPYCPMPAAVLDAKTMTCSSAFFEQPLTQCPAGFQPCDAGKKDHGGKKHGGKKHGYGLAAPGCCLARYAPPLPGCPLGANLVGGQCLIATQPLFECPPGAIREGDFCYIINTKPPKIHYQINVTTKQSAPIIENTHKHKHKKHH